MKKTSEQANPRTANASLPGLILEFFVISAIKRGSQASFPVEKPPNYGKKQRFRADNKGLPGWSGRKFQ
jgi:hypothetical protein